MNKKAVNEAIPFAYEALSKSGIAQNGCVDRKYRGQISSFGAAISLGSLLPAVAFFSDQGAAEVDRTRLLDAILFILKKQKKCTDDISKLFEYVNIQISKSSEYIAKENIVNAAIALKLAMNLYTLN